MDSNLIQHDSGAPGKSVSIRKQDSSELKFRGFRCVGCIATALIDNVVNSEKDCCNICIVVRNSYIPLKQACCSGNRLRRGFIVVLYNVCF